MPNFELSTKYMNEAANNCQKLAEMISDYKQEMKNAKDDLMFSWAGKGADEFDCQFRILLQQVTDVSDCLWDMAERIIACYEAYVEADTKAAQQLDGVSRGIDTVSSDDYLSGYSG